MLFQLLKADVDGQEPTCKALSKAVDAMVAKSTTTPSRGLKEKKEEMNHLLHDVTQAIKERQNKIQDALKEVCVGKLSGKRKKSWRHTLWSA